MTFSSHANININPIPIILVHKELPPALIKGRGACVGRSPVTTPCYKSLKA